MNSFNWSHPHCERPVTITDNRQSIEHHTLNIGNAEGRRSLVSTYLVCPNPDCKRFTLTATLYESSYQSGGAGKMRAAVQHLNLVPDSWAKNFPAYIPHAILHDYREACLIKDLSPKASAMLSRRCLQGMIRDFWEVRPSRLVDEAVTIKSQVDPLNWDAIEAVRKIGNIGAHMERDIDVIIEVDPDEADLLIELIETLVHEWYINREERRTRMGHLVAAGAAKKPPSP